jgi:hypothetical protein
VEPGPLFDPFATWRLPHLPGKGPQNPTATRRLRQLSGKGPQNPTTTRGLTHLPGKGPQNTTATWRLRQLPGKGPHNPAGKVPWSKDDLLITCMLTKTNYSCFTFFPAPQGGLRTAAPPQQGAHRYSPQPLPAPRTGFRTSADWARETFGQF